MKFTRVWAMPSSDTFSVRPIGDFVRSYLAVARISVDPFARNNAWATYTNDINPGTSAQRHMDAEDFLYQLRGEGLGGSIDLAILDPPYSPRQISECYQEIGRKVGMTDTQSSVLYSRVRAALLPLLTPDATVLSFGWSSQGMGAKHGFNIFEILLVAHGGAHNDTICLAETRLQQSISEVA